VVAQSLGAVAPTAALATTPAVVLAAGAGPAAVWSVLLGSVVVLLAAGAINVFTRRLAAPGSLYTFAAQGLGPAAAFATGCALLLGYAFVTMASLVGSARHGLSLVGHWWPAALAGGAEPLALVVLVVLVGAGVGLAVRRGARAASVLLVALEVVAVGVVVAVLVTLLTAPGPHLGATATLPVGSVPLDVPVDVPVDVPTHSAGSGWTDLAGVLAGAMLAVSALIGFESASALGPEARRPFAVVPRVVTWTAVAGAVLVVLGAWAQADGFGALGLDPARTSTPLNDLVRARGLPAGWQPLLDVAVATSFLACATASCTALVRLLFALGTEGMLPRALGRVHRRHRTPHVALAVALPVLVAVPAVALLAGATVRTVTDTLIGASVLGYVLAYLGVCVAAPRFLRRIGEATPGPVTGARVATGALATLVVAFAGREVAHGRPVAVLTVAALLATGAAVYRSAHRRRPDRVRAIGVYDSTSEEDVARGRTG
jgi:amino acid transporter